MPYTVCMIRVGIIRGGVGEGYDESLKSGAFFLANLPRDTYQALDIFIDKEGAWHLHGKPVSHEQLMHKADVLWNLTHGYYGADGKMHQLFEQLGMPYVGPSPLGSAVTMHHGLLRNALTEGGIKTPRSLYVSDWKDDTQEHVAAVVRGAFENFAPPWIVRTVSRGHMQGHIHCATRDELTAVLLQMADSKVPVVIEELVTGKQLSVLVAPGFRNEELYTFLPRDMQVSGRRLAREESEPFQSAARRAHRHLGLGSHAVVSGIITARGDVYITEIDAHPSFAQGSHATQSLEELGVTFGEFAKHAIDAAFTKN